MGEAEHLPLPLQSSYQVMPGVGAWVEGVLLEGHMLGAGGDRS